MKKETRSLSEEARKRAVVLEAANRMALDILASATGLEALTHITEAARELAHAQHAALGIAKPDGRGLSEFITVGLTAHQEERIGPRPKGIGVLGLLLESQQPLRIDDLSRHPASAGFPENHPIMTSFLGVPIMRGETVIGSLYLVDKHGRQPFTEADEIAVQALASHAAAAIHNFQMLSRQRALVSGLIQAQEEERRAVAYELHDGLTQYVMAAHAHFEAFKRASQAGKQEKADKDLEQGLNYLKDAVIESRRLVNGLRSLALDDLGLAGALELLLNEEQTRNSWEVEFIHNIADRRFDRSLEIAAYRIAQEALTNARKHSGTLKMHVRLLEERSSGLNAPQLKLEVRDWGCGFVPKDYIEDSSKVGLQSMAERTSLINGVFEIKSTPGKGTVIKAAFPIVEAYEGET